MPVKREILQETLEKAFPNSDIELKSLTGDDDHWQATIKSAAFLGKTKINQHRMVTDALNHLNIHALSIKTIIG
jgi:stress-induced morphogen